MDDHKIHMATATPRGLAKQKRSRKEVELFMRSGVMTGGNLGYSDANTLGAAIIRKIKSEEERMAQHGAVKTLFLDRSPVPIDQQLWTKAEIRAWRRANSG